MALERIDRNIDRYDHIIAELLDFTCTSKFNWQTIRIDEWLESVVDEQDIVKYIQIDKDLSLNGVKLVVEPDRIRRAIKPSWLNRAV